MGRVCSISPEDCCSETLARLSSRAERTFWRLLTQCDDRGRALFNLRLLKAQLYPMHDAVTPETLKPEFEELKAVGLIRVYEAAGKSYLAVLHWDEFQHSERRMGRKGVGCV